MRHEPVLAIAEPVTMSPKFEAGSHPPRVRTNNSGRELKCSLPWTYGTISVRIYTYDEQLI
jgi:hypothetical protein